MKLTSSYDIENNPNIEIVFHSLDFEVGTWFHSDKKDCLDDYAEVKYTPALMRNSEPSPGSLIVMNNSDTHYYAASELGIPISICGTYKVFTSDNNNILFRFVDNPLER